jgi:pyruvate kinase
VHAEENGRRCFAIREAAKALHRTVSVIQDLQGPRIRVGRLVEGRPVLLRIGQELKIISRDIEGTADCISTTYDGLAADVRPGDGIWLDDGRLRLRVLDVTSDEVVPDESVCRRLALWWGVTPVHQADRRDLDESIAAMEEYLLLAGAADVGDAVMVAGLHPFSIGTPMNFAKYQQISPRAIREAIRTPKAHRTETMEGFAPRRLK